MSTCMDDPSDQEFQAVFSNICWGSKENPYHPEHNSSKKYHDERRKFSSPWDNLINWEERNKIIHLDVESKKSIYCENLKRARGAKEFYYCQTLADIEVASGSRKFTVSRATKDSAENAARCSYWALKSCTSPKHKEECQVLKYINLESDK